MITEPSLTYQQFQQQRFATQEQQTVMAQQAIVSAGADSFSQKVMDTITQLRAIGNSLMDAEKQGEAQWSAQQRQYQQMKLKIDQMCAQLQQSSLSSTR